MAHLAREVARRFEPERVLKQDAKNPITLESLHAARVRTLIFITDYIGSGKQVVDYVSAWRRNPRIRSWMSFGWTKMLVISFAASAVGRTVVQSIPHAPELDVVEIAPSVDAPAEWAQQRDIVDLCMNYARRADLTDALGFAESGGLFASSLSVPNNLPAILWKEAPGRWMPFFAGRTMSSELASAIGDFTPERDLVHELELEREKRLAERFAEGTVRSRWGPYLAEVALLPADDETVALRLGQSVLRTREIRSVLEQLGLVDADGVPTADGQKAISRSSRRPRTVTAGLSGKDAPYYPRLTR